LARTPPTSDPRKFDIAAAQHTALLRTTLARITRYAEQMKADLDGGELNLAHADQLGQAVLTALRESASICARAEVAARSVA
jgi:hypothetical protein